MGMHREWPQLFMKTGAGLSIFGFHLNIFLHSIQEKHDRMYETLLSKLKEFLVAVETLRDTSLWNFFLFHNSPT